jgi:hypothetical protein
LRLLQTISSASAKEGEEVLYEVAEALKVEGVVVLPEGAKAVGSVVDAAHKASMGRGGKLSIKVVYAVMADQEKLYLTASERANGRHPSFLTSAAGLVVPEVGIPLILFRKGQNISITEGTRVTAYVQGDTHIDLEKLAAAAQNGLVSAPSAQASGGAEAQIAVPTTPADKATVYVYRLGEMKGAENYWFLYANGTFVGTLLNSTYAKAEVAAGTVVFSDLHRMHLWMPIEGVTSEMAKTPKELYRMPVEAGKTYYVRWVVGAWGPRMVPVDKGTGKNEMGECHLSKDPVGTDPSKSR